MPQDCNSFVRTQLFNPDGIFMREHPVNSGAFAIRATNRSRAWAKVMRRHYLTVRTACLLACCSAGVQTLSRRRASLAQAWLGKKSYADRTNMSDQDSLAALEGSTYKCCETAEDCASIMVR